MYDAPRCMQHVTPVQSRLFKKNAGKLKNTMWWQNKKMCMILTLVAVVILAIIGIIIYVKVK